MDKKRAFVIMVMALLITLALTFAFSNLFNITGDIPLTGKVADTYLEDLELYGCLDAGKWDMEMGDYKLTKCPDKRPLMNGVGIAVTNDDQTGGRAYCCKAENLELEDCQEESFWEEDTQDFKLTICPDERPIMKGIGIRVRNNNQAGGKVYCCKAKNLELKECAITSYWRKVNQDYELHYCPEDRRILGGVGFNIQSDDQAGGKLYCCKGRVRLSSDDEEIISAPEIEEIKIEEEPKVEPEGFGSIIKKLFCKIIHSKNIEKFNICIQ